MRRLIVNADDFGSGIERDRGILQCFRDGIVSSASLLANGPSFISAAVTTQEYGLPVGVHLNLSEGVALGGAIPGLTAAGGTFPGKTGLRLYLAGEEVNPAPLYRELALQIERVLAAGIIPDHLDTHQHFFLFPVATTIVIALAKEYGIPALRLPSPAEDPLLDPAGELGEELILYRRLAPACIAQLQASGISAPDGLFGMPLLNRLNLQTLGGILSQIPAGWWELMVHPGYPDDLVPFAGVERQAEVTALSSAAIAAALRRCDITVVTFKDLACAS